METSPMYLDQDSIRNWASQRGNLTKQSNTDWSISNPIRRGILHPLNPHRGQSRVDGSWNNPGTQARNSSSIRLQSGVKPTIGG